MTAVARSKLETDPDGAAVEIFPLPADEASLKELLCDLFERHWHDKEERNATAKLVVCIC